MRPVRSILPHLSLSLAVLLAAGCQPITGAFDDAAARSGVIVPEGEVRVIEASASPSVVEIRLSDGARCTADRPEGEAGGWSGVTSDCGYQLPYTVTFQQGTVPQRFAIETPTAGTGPRAEIFVTDVDGVRRLFSSPLGDNVRFDTGPAPVPAG